MLLEQWERFALPIRSVPAPGVGSLPASGTLLAIGGVELSAVRRTDDGIEVRVWNPRTEPAEASIAGRPVSLGAAEIRALDLEGTG